MNSTIGTTLMGMFEFVTLVFHSTVWNVRKTKGNALTALAMEVAQACIIVVFFYVMISFMGMRSFAIRGSFILYVMSGVFLYMTHNKAIGAVAAGAVGSPLLNHRPVSTLLLIISGALSALYIQIFAVLVITFAANVLIEPFTFYNIKGFAFAFFMAWASGVGIGIVFLSLKPFFPGTIGLVQTIYTRANMIFSGKMLPANTLPNFMLPYFTWNPLFHTIDYGRGAAFVNYTAHKTDIWYAVWVTLICIALGLMMEHWSRKYYSASWQARS